MFSAVISPAPRRIKPRPKPYSVNIGRFYFALILAPIITAILGCWLLLIPVFAVAFGGLPWLLIGGPVLWFTLRRYGNSAVVILAAVLANLIGTPLLVFLVSLVEPHTDLTELLWFMVGFGIPFSFVWSAVFGWLYGTQAAPAKSKSTQREGGLI